MGSSMLSIRPSSRAIPTNADTKDLVTENAICLLVAELSFQ